MKKVIETLECCAYPPEYKGPKPIVEQVQILAETFELSTTETLKYVKTILPTLKLPESAEGWFAFPSIDALARRLFPEVDSPEERYSASVVTVETFISISRPFSGKIGDLAYNNFKQTEHSELCMRRISEKQKGDILILPAQFGARYSGLSFNGASNAMQNTANEFALGSFVIESMTFVHPERFVRWEQLHTYCAGDRLRLDPSYIFVAPLLAFGRNGLKRGIYYPDEEIKQFGSPSGFVM